MIEAVDHGVRVPELRSALWLLCRLGARLCALRLENVVETMRPLPVESIAGAPRFVQGLALIRGVPVPVVDIALLFNECDSAPQRWVTIDAGGRIVALAVDHVVGVRAIGTGAGTDLPPLLRDAAEDVVTAMGTLDSELLLFLSAARLIPQELHDRISAEGRAQ